MAHGICSECSSVPTPDNVYDCSGCGISEIPTFPNTSRVILLSNNSISAIRRQSFQYLTDLQELHLDFNEIRLVEDGCFQEVNSMKKLNISWNKLSTRSLENLAMPSGLQSLDIRMNCYEEYPSSIQSLTQLRILNIDIFNGFHFEKRFLSLTKLSSIIFNPRSDFSLKNHTFEGLSKAPLENISMDFSGFVKKPVEINFLRPFHSIERLKIDMGGLFDIVDILKYLYGLRNTTLEKMDISGNNWYTRRIHFLRKQDLDNLLTMCVKEINIGYNYILYFPFLDVLDSRFYNCIEKLIIEANNIVWTTDEIFGMIYLPSIKYLDISVNMQCSYRSKAKVSNEIHTKPSGQFFNITSKFLKSLEYIDLSRLDLYVGNLGLFRFLRNFTVVFDVPNLKVIKAAFTRAEFCNYDYVFNGNLSVLDMSGWNCNQVNPKFIQRHDKLTFLNASFSNLGHFINRKDQMSLFHGLSELKTLDISYNEIFHLNDNIFHSQNASMKYINLSHNNLRRIPKAILSLTGVISIDFSYNEIEYFGQEDRHIIGSLVNTSFNFEGNHFDCSCYHVHSLVWINKSKNIQKLACKDGNMTDILINIRLFQLKCLSEFWLDMSVVSLLLIIVSLVVVATGFRNKSFVIYLYIKARRVIKQANTMKEGNSYTYDAFVSYSHMDEEWVTGPLFQYLNNELSLQICIHHKDFIPGEPIAEEILRCIDSSRKSVFVITRNFLASNWSLFEMDIARRHVFQSDSDTILVILKDDIPVHEMPNMLRKIWWRIVCLKYPQKNDVSDMGMFWKKLSEVFGRN